ncbi:Tryptophan synthase beta chain [Dissostichus eleginoides]|uniref:Tryptophan synthase beta chain n=1 Tax=Dissostichus eleginoides TaxID=100907 RepID=A0AAD9B5W1_DISEL|nr:Tryptophan synthase beta chain [Dissostichus eleginoides]
MDWRSLPSSGDTHQRIVGLAAKRLGMGPPVVGCCHGDGAEVQCINLIGISHNPNWTVRERQQEERIWFKKTGYITPGRPEHGL